MRKEGEDGAFGMASSCIFNQSFNNFLVPKMNTVKCSYGHYGFLVRLKRINGFKNLQQRYSFGFDKINLSYGYLMDCFLGTSKYCENPRYWEYQCQFEKKGTEKLLIMNC